MKPTTINQRFFSKVNISEGCWIWKGYKNVKGYGKFNYDGNIRNAHRIMWFLTNGIIKNRKLLVLHKCDNPSCVNPSHLFLGNHYDNRIDCINKGRNKPNPLRGELSPKSKLKTDDVIKIKELIGKFPQCKIAKQFNISPSSVCLIKKSKTWSHINV